MAKPEQLIKFIFNKPDDYRIVYVNGVVGSVTPRGDICCHFYQEYPTIPKEQEFKLKGDGKLGEQVDKQTVPSLSRDLKIGIVFKIEDAENIANFLLEKVKSLKGEKP